MKSKTRRKKKKKKKGNHHVGVWLVTNFCGFSGYSGGEKNNGVIPFSKGLQGGHVHPLVEAEGGNVGGMLGELLSRNRIPVCDGMGNRGNVRLYVNDRDENLILPAAPLSDSFGPQGYLDGEEKN